MCPSLVSVLVSPFSGFDQTHEVTSPSVSAGDQLEAVQYLHRQVL